MVEKRPVDLDDLAHVKQIVGHPGGEDITGADRSPRRFVDDVPVGVLKP
ncbi:MAG: hypothetical protein R2873_30005 [Caldilineaceae bacterium]